MSSTVSFLNGKSAVRIHRELMKHRRITGLHSWAVGDCVSPVGLNEEAIRKYARGQDARDRRLDQPELGYE